MTTLNFALTRTLGRELRAGDEIVVTRLDHDGNISPWLHLAEDLDLAVRFVDLNEDDATLDMDDLERQLSERTRVVAFPLASNAVGTVTDARRIVELAHDAGALAWVDAVHYAPHCPIDVRELGADVLLCSPYKFFGPHLGLFYGRRDLLERLRPYKVRPAPDEPVSTRFETGTLSHEALAGFIAAVAYIESVGWEGIAAHERELGERLLGGLPDELRLLRSADDGGAGGDVRRHRPGTDAGAGGDAARRARPGGLVGRLLRGRGDEAPRPAGRGSPPRDHPLQHRRGGRPPPGRPPRPRSSCSGSTGRGTTESRGTSSWGSRTWSS